VIFHFSSPLYAIVDPTLRPDLDPSTIADEMLCGGARLLQLRWKEAPSGALLAAARDLRRRTRLHGALLIVNDRVDVARAAEADGVHLGQEDLPPEVARREIGSGRILGVSTHDEEQARAAERAGADYIGFGPIHRTSTKELRYATRGVAPLRRVRAATRLPIVAIGGIDAESAIPVFAAGADAVAMISALVRAPSIRDEVARILSSLSRH
jgi:thiamine-phosphate diphosphorylase